MKQTVIIGILLGILLLTGCDNNEKEHDFVGIFTTANGIKFELRPDSTSIITFKDSMIYESSWKISKDRNNETYANIEFAGYQNYYYLKNGKLYRSIREMNHDALGEEVKYPYRFPRLSSLSRFFSPHFASTLPPTSCIPLSIGI